MVAVKNLLFKVLVFFLGFMDLRSSERIVYTPDGLIEEAFVTFATENYFPILEVLLNSIEAFSSRPIVVFGINKDVPFSNEKYPFMIKKRIDLSSASRTSIFFAKPQVILEAGILRGIYVDADMILNEGFDVLFEHCKRDINYPLSPTFPWEVNNQQLLMQALGVTKKSMQYVHAPLIVFPANCRPFIREWLQVNLDFGNLAVCHDETVLNVLLWKHEITDSIPLCDPFYALAYDYLDGKTVQHVSHGYKDWVGQIDFLTFHGCKSGREAKEILNRLIARRDRR